jgi:hypothetical protein
VEFSVGTRGDEFRFNAVFAYSQLREGFIREIRVCLNVTMIFDLLWQIVQPDIHGMRPRNVALTVVLLVIVNVQVGLPAQAPVKPSNSVFVKAVSCGAPVSVICVPIGNVETQVESNWLSSHLIPFGEEVTIPMVGPPPGTARISNVSRALCGVA